MIDQHLILQVVPQIQKNKNVHFQLAFDAHWISGFKQHLLPLLEALSLFNGSKWITGVHLLSILSLFNHLQ